MLTASKRVAAGAATASLLVGLCAAPALATPAEEAVYLAAMKEAWQEQKPKVQRTTCYAYRIAPRQVITQSLEAVIKDPTTADVLAKPAWRRVITDYLAWACSGPGTTPR